MSSTLCALLLFALASLTADAYLITCPSDAVVNCPEGFDPCASAEACPTGQHCQKAPCSCSPICKPDGMMNALIVAAADTPTYSNNSCPTDKPFTPCFADPCWKSNCTANQTCFADTCGGCYFRCQDNPSAPPAAMPNDVCPDGMPLTNCLVNPCSQPNNCTGENVVCRANYCGGCTAECLKLEMATALPSSIPIKPSCDPSNCKMDPCSTIRCMGGTTCLADYCSCTGSCKAASGTNCSPNKCQFISDPCMGCNGDCTVDYCACTAKCTAKVKKCTYNPCARVRCEPSYYKTTCVPDKETCDFKCMALPLPTCTAGYGFSSTLKACTKCRLGHVSSSGANMCAACEVNHYEVKNVQCVPCPAGSTTNGRTAQSRCTKVNAQA